MTAQEWDDLPWEKKVTWTAQGWYCACERCKRPLPRWMAEAWHCPECGDLPGVLWRRLPEEPGAST